MLVISHLLPVKTKRKEKKKVLECACLLNNQFVILKKESVSYLVQLIGDSLVFTVRHEAEIQLGRSVVF